MVVVVYVKPVAVVFQEIVVLNKMFNVIIHIEFIVLCNRRETAVELDAMWKLKQAFQLRLEVNKETFRVGRIVRII